MLVYIIVTSKNSPSVEIISDNKLSLGVPIAQGNEFKNLLRIII